MSVRVRAAPFPPYGFASVEGGNQTFIRGIAGDVYEAMKLIMPFEYDSVADKQFGVKHPNGSWSGMIGSSIRNETDISGPYIINEPRSHVIEFSVPVTFSQLSIVSGLVSTNKDPSLIFRIFSVPVWLMIPVSVFLTACAATIIYQILPSQEKKGVWSTLFKYTWALQFSMIGADFGHNNRWFVRHVSSSPSFRFLLTVWFLVASLVLNYTYQGGIISAFSSDNLKPKIETLDDLLEDKTMAVGTFKNNYPHFALKTLEDTKYDSIWQRAQQGLMPTHRKGEIPKWTEKVEAGEMVFVSEILTIQDMIGERFMKTGKCGIRTTIVDQTLQGGYICFGFRKELKETTLFQRFSQGTRRYFEASLSHFQLTNATLFYNYCTGAKVSVTDALTFNDLLGAFLLLGTGLGLSILILLLEICAHRQKRKNFKMLKVLEGVDPQKNNEIDSV